MNAVLAVNLAAAVAFAAVGVMAWHRRRRRRVAAAALLGISVGGAWWALSVGLSSTPAVPGADVIGLLIYPGIGLSVAGFIVLAVTLGRPGWTPSRWVVAALAVEPVLITLLALTNRWHGLVYAWVPDWPFNPAGATGPADVIVRGPGFWLHAAYSYGALLGGAALQFLGWRRSPRVFRSQRFLIFLGSAFPIVVNAAYLAGLLGSEVEPTSPAFACTAVILGYAVLRYDLLGLAPVARDLVVDRMGDAIVAMAPDGTIVDANPAAVALVAKVEGPGAGVAGRKAADLLGGALVRAARGATQVKLAVAGEPRDLHLSWTALVDARGQDLGSAVLLRDVTELQEQRRELAVTNRRLVGQVRTIERLRRELVDQATRDPLTGLHNRRHADDQLASMLQAVERSGVVMSVLMIDLDHFKAVNDRYGHAAGDAVLVDFARALLDLAPPGSVAARWGGEEFLVVLPGSPVEEARRFGERLREAVSARAVEAQGRSVRYSLSAGVAGTDDHGTRRDAVLAAADRALYAAKESGRDRVAVPPPRHHRDDDPDHGRGDDRDRPIGSATARP